MPLYLVSSNLTVYMVPAYLGSIQAIYQGRGHLLPYKSNCLDQVSVYRTIGPLVLMYVL